MRMRLAALAASVLCACAAQIVLAGGQTVGATTGSINGKVSDTSSAVLPGATVTIMSSTLQGLRTDVTDAEGGYRFAAVPPGDYRITYELPGFATLVREGVRVGLGFTATINAEMKVGTLQETVTVSGASPVVDITSTKTATNFDAKTLESLPNARDYWAILAQAPAIQVSRIDVGGSSAGTQTSYSAYDTKSDQHRPMVEGIINTEGTNGAGYYYDYGAFSEVSVGTGTNSAEMPWPGVLSQFIAKSGGNTYHGRLYTDYQNENIQGRNIDAAQIALGVKGSAILPATDLNRMHQYYDLNGDLGGYIKPDKLWFYGSARKQDIQSWLPNFAVQPFETELRNITSKVTYSLNNNNKLVGFGMWGRKFQPNRLDTYLISATSAIHSSVDSTLKQQYWGHTYKGEWNSVVSNKIFLEVHGGEFGYDWPYHRYSNAPAFADTSTNVVSGGNQDGWWTDRYRDQAMGSISIAKDGWGGSHNFKFGGELLAERAELKRGDGGVGNLPGDVLHVLKNGIPSEVYLFNSPVDSKDGLITTGLYATDTWRPTSRTTLSLGLRFDRYQSYLPAQDGPPVNGVSTHFAAVGNLMTWNLPAPRLGITYDLFGNGKTVLKGNYAQYWWNPGTVQIDENANNNPVDWYNRYAWSDKNGNGVFDQGEQGTLIASRGGVGSAILDPNLKDTYTREAAVWVEHELRPSFGVHAGLVWRRINQLAQLNNVNRPFGAFTVPVTISDPGPDGKLGTADDGVPIQGYNLSAAALALPVTNILQNTGGRDDFYTAEFSASKRAGRWTVNTSFSYRWNYDNSVNYFGNSLRQTGQADVVNPNDLINTDNGRFDFTTWAYKINGSVDVKWGLKITPSLRTQSGQPFGRTFQATMNFGTERVLAEPISTRRQDNINVVDIRVEKSMKLGHGSSVSGFIDGYNLLNTNAASNINWASGGTFLTPSTIVPPRIARFGVKVDF